MNLTKVQAKKGYQQHLQQVAQERKGHGNYKMDSYHCHHNPSEKPIYQLRLQQTQLVYTERITKAWRQRKAMSIVQGLVFLFVTACLQY